jgi:hypothetical protein
VDLWVGVVDRLLLLLLLLLSSEAYLNGFCFQQHSSTAAPRLLSRSVECHVLEIPDEDE